MSSFLGQQFYRSTLYFYKNGFGVKYPTKVVYHKTEANKQPTELRSTQTYTQIYIREYFS